MVDGPEVIRVTIQVVPDQTYDVDDLRPSASAPREDRARAQARAIALDRGDWEPLFIRAAALVYVPTPDDELVALPILTPGTFGVPSDDADLIASVRDDELRRLRAICAQLGLDHLPDREDGDG